MIKKPITYHKFFTLRSLFRGVIMVVFQRVVADDVVVNKRVPLRPEIPWLLLWIVWSVFEPAQLVFEIEHVESLLVPQRPIFILGEHVYEVFIIYFPCLMFNTFVSINLSDWVVLGLLSLDKLISYFNVRISLSLKVGFLVDVISHVCFPISVIIFPWEEDLV